MKEFRVVRRVISTQAMHVDALDSEEATTIAIRAQDYEWDTEPAPQVIRGTEKAIDVTEPTEIPEV